MPAMKELKPRGFGACPTFVVGWCYTAKGGGASGYQAVGRQIVSHLGGSSLCPYEVEDEDWQERVEELTTLIDESNDSAVLAWFDRWVPRCMALIPRRRRAAFLAGVYEFVEEGGEIEF